MGQADQPSAPAEQLRAIREEIRFEIGLLHDRVNALLAAEAFLTIAFVAAMSDGAQGGARFAAVVSPILSLLGLLLAGLAWPGIEVTVKLVFEWTGHQVALMNAHPELSTRGSVWAVEGAAKRSEPDRGGAKRNAGPDQRRAMLFFRAVPALFTVVWALLTVVALVFRR